MVRSHSYGGRGRSEEQEKLTKSYRERERVSMNDALSLGGHGIRRVGRQ